MAAQARRTITWFPGHMRKATQIIEDKLRSAEAVVEIRDARVPLSSINPSFEELVTRYDRPRVVVMNKADLVSNADKSRIIRYVEGQQNARVLFTSAKQQSKSIMNKLSKEILKETGRPKFRHGGVMALVVGMPNVGKSSVINLLRSGLRLDGGSSHRQGGGGKKRRRTNVAKTGATPGLTRHVSPIQIARDPSVFLFDTPGIMVPRIVSDDVGMRLALAGIIPEKVVPAESMVPFLLEIMNNSNNLQYASALKLPSEIIETGDAELLMDTVAQNIGRGGSGARLDAARHIMAKYRKGDFGKFLLDDTLR